MPKCSDDVCAGRDQVVIATTSERERGGEGVQWEMASVTRTSMLGNLAVCGRFLDASQEMRPEGASSRDRQKGRMGSGAVRCNRRRSEVDGCWC
jgi:hypothetical protein